MEEVISFKVFHRRFYLLRPKGLEKWWQDTLERGDEISERFPYWLDVWPSSVVLAKFILKHPHLFKDKIVLDIGCGLGALSLALLLIGAKVISQDIEFESLIYCKKNFSHNRLPSSLCIQGDWNLLSYKKESVDIMVGGDIIYEKKNHSSLVVFIINILKKDGLVYMASPYREGSFDFFQKAKEKGLLVRRLSRQGIIFNHQNPEIFLWEISKPFSIY